MSRIILSKYDNDNTHIVVGWDPLVKSFFWQEFNRIPDPDPETGEVDWSTAIEAGWEEWKNGAGDMPREIQTTSDLKELMPEEHRNLLGKDVEAILFRHADRNDSESIIDMTPGGIEKAQHAIDVDIRSGIEAGNQYESQED